MNMSDNTEQILHFTPQNEYRPTVYVWKVINMDTFRMDDNFFFNGLVEPFEWLLHSLQMAIRFKTASR